MHISEDQHANCLSRLCTPVLTSREGQDFLYRRRLSILHAMPNRAFCSISLWIFTTTPNPQRQESTSSLRHFERLVYTAKSLQWAYTNSDTNITLDSEEESIQDSSQIQTGAQTFITKSQDLYPSNTYIPGLMTPSHLQQSPLRPPYSSSSAQNLRLSTDSRTEIPLALPIDSNVNDAIRFSSLET